ncbi:MAG: VWA domain-containing protein [Acidobacteriota bacterium]
MQSPSERSTFLANLVHFARALRQVRIEVTPAQLADLTAALEVIDLRQRSEVKAATRAVLTSRRRHRELFDPIFDLFWHQDARLRRRIDLGQSLRRIAEQQQQQVMRSFEPPEGEAPRLDADIVETVALHSDAERLRRKDFARLTDDERRQLLRLIAESPLTLELRRTRRTRTGRRGGRLDLAATLRRSLRSGGEPVVRRYRRRRTKPRPLVVLCDISGSMEAYARVFLPFIYSLRGATQRLEVFVFATRLTRITRELGHRQVDRALSEAAAAIVDWGGGTRIGESFRAFHRDWGRRVLGGGSVTLVLSDAWDRGDAAVLGAQTARLARRTSRLLWLNPLIAGDGYRPIASGVRAILPHVDDFLPLHDLQSLEDLASRLRDLGLGRRRRRP